MTQDEFLESFGALGQAKRVKQLNDFWEQYRNVAVPFLELNTPMRQAAFIAQVAHESDSFRALEEYASGEAYEGRKDLGNTVPGDGKRFKGRGYIQLTGRGNYAEFTKWYEMKANKFRPNPDFVARPELVATPYWGMMATVFFWETRKLNALADKGLFKTLTRRINGGLNGYAHRLAIFENVKKELTS